MRNFHIKFYYAILQIKFTQSNFQKSIFQIELVKIDLKN